MIFEAYARWLINHPKYSLLIALLLTLVFAFCGKDVRLSNHFASLFSVDNAENQYREFYREQFGADDGLLLAMLRPGTVDKTFFNQLDDLTKTLEDYPHFVRVLSVTNTSVVWSDDDVLYVDPLFGEYDTGLPIDRKLALLKTSPSTANRLASIRYPSFAIMAEMPRSYDRLSRIKEPSEFFRQKVEAAFGNNGVKIDFAGITYTRIAILDLMIADLLLLVPLTSLAIAIFSMLLFRRAVTVWSVMLTSVFGASATIGLMGLNGDNIDQLTITFPVLLMVIIVANSVHFFHRYFSEMSRGATVEDAVYATCLHVSKAAFLSCFTTMIGFYALLTADMAILRGFGFYLGTGIFLSYLGMILILPACLLLNRPQAPPVKGFGDFLWIDRLAAFSTVSPGRYIMTVTGIILIVIGSWIGSKADYDYVLSDMLDEDHPQVVSGDIVDEHMSGSLPIEISLLGEPGDFKKARNLRKMMELSEWLAVEQFDQDTLSLAALLRVLNLEIGGEDEVPDSDEAIAQLLLLVEGSSDNILDQLVSNDFSHARIRANSADIGAARLVAFQKKFESAAAEIFRDTGIEVHLTGEIMVAYKGMNRLTDELIQSVLTALVFIVITILLVFRDFRLAVGSIFPNILPIIVGLGFYTLSGKGLNPLPGLAFCIAIGIAVDDTVHLFARFNEELGKGVSRRDAVLEAVKGIKVALFSSSLILTIGFLMFLFSGFSWNRDLGGLGALLIVVALFADLLFTPAILAIEKKQPKAVVNR